MSLYEKTYSIENDFPNKKVSTDRLYFEILNCASFTTALDHIDTDAELCYIYFRGEISQSEETALIGIVMTHSGEPLEDASTPVVIKEVTSSLPVVQKGFPDYTGYPFFVDSIWGNAAANVTSAFNLCFSQKVRFQGGTVEVLNANEGDYFMGDVTYGENGISVYQFITKRGVIPGVAFTWERTLPDSKEIPVGCYLRMRYVNTGMNPVFIVASYDLRRTS